MKSDSLWTNCKVCNENISRSSKECPKCGAKLKKLSILHWIGIVFFLLFLIVLANPSAKTNKSNDGMTRVSSSDSASQLSKEQKDFVAVVTQNMAAFQDAKNELQQSVLKDQRRAGLSKALNSRTVTSWVGNISKLETNTEGNAILSIKISPNINITTWNNALSDIASGTLIDKSSRLYNDLLDLSIKDKVAFSGSFFPSPDDFIEENSITIEGSMLDPEYLFRFTSVNQIK